MDGEQLLCERDGAPTRLRCAACQVGICPACLVRSPVGHKCRRCGGTAGAATARPSRARALVLAGAALVAAGVALTLLRAPGDTTVTDPVGVERVQGAGAASGQLMLGEEARDGQLVFVAEDVSCRLKQGTDDRTAGKLCTLRFTVKNGSDSPALLLARFQYLVDGQGKTYGADEGLTRAMSDSPNRGLSDLTVNPDVVVPLAFVFDLPEQVDPTEVQFRGNGRSRFGVNVRLLKRA